MRGILALSLSWLAAITGTIAQHVHYDIPEVRYQVHSMLNRFDEYTDYNGPAKTASVKPYPTERIITAQGDCSYWLENVKHQGVAAFNSNPSTYQVFRNVKDFGAKGDGVTDDTAAINRAISSGGRCEPGACASSTTSPAIVYFPSGVYMVSDSIIDYYYTMLIGNPNCLPTIKALPEFHGGLGVIDGNRYGAGGLGFGATNVFWRQIRNFIIDTTLVPASSSVTGIHWPTAQATSIQNVQFRMSRASGTMHQGIFIEEGSGGFMNDLTFTGGLYGLNVGNQQFTMRNLRFDHVDTAINQIWDWGWTYYGLSINNCRVGIQMSSGGPDALSVGSIALFDSTITNTPVGVVTGRTADSQPDAANSLIIENVDLTNVPIAVQLVDGSMLLGGSTGNRHISAWGQGHAYTPAGPKEFRGSIQPANRPSSLLSGGRYYQRSKPQYNKEPLSSFISARSQGAKGDGRSDDTQALQRAINAAKFQGKILFLDHGDYKVTSTIYIPGGSRIVGEAYSVILSCGAYFNDIQAPKPVVQIGKENEGGSVELSDFIISTQGQQKGAVLIQYNLASSTSSPSGLWDVHVRVAGFAGSSLQLPQCPTTPETTITKDNLDQDCISTYLSMHVTKGSSGLYAENVWLWVADHDIEDPSLRQITIYAGRGMLVESQKGGIWLVGTGVEHHVKYEYQFVNTRDIFMGQIQTESAYYQPNPSAPLPFPYDSTLSDPQFQTKTVQDNGKTIPAADGWGLRIKDSTNILVYGAGLYSFFNNYSTACSTQEAGEICQDAIFSLEGTNPGVTIYNLNTVGTHWMLSLDGRRSAIWTENKNGFVDTIALFRGSGYV
ncbi:hypothetical protein MBLNU230_g8013t1 [Neophaeotheca triangularis]